MPSPKAERAAFEPQLRLALDAPKQRHKSIFVRTTFDLPSDVTDTLRRESARRGGRAKAPMNQLIAEAVRMVFQPAKSAVGARAVARPGKGLVVMPKGVRITDADVASALEEML
jgi:hypothetical protein